MDGKNNFRNSILLSHCLKIRQFHVCGEIFPNYVEGQWGSIASQLLLRSRKVDIICKREGNGHLNKAGLEQTWKRLFFNPCFELYEFPQQENPLIFEVTATTILCIQWGLLQEYAPHSHSHVEKVSYIMRYKFWVCGLLW